MPKAQNSVASHQRRKKIRKQARGYYGARSRLIKTMRDSVRRAHQYSYAHRRKRPGVFRRLWIMRINAACRINDMSYSRFINGLKIHSIEIDRKMLADMAVNDPNAFNALAEKVRAAV
ncbi:MAG: 50S ribosomal protein L20 [Candidatus Electryoneaceae bacterium]|nr:50S ribosomal protein L20 [Candidatus Electryoneaceae bacterium]